MKIKMLRNLGLGWTDAETLREGTTHDVPTALGNRLAAAGLCEVLERDAPPAPALKVEQPKPIEPPAVKAPAPPQQPQPTRQPQPKRGR